MLSCRRLDRAGQEHSAQQQGTHGSNPDIGELQLGVLNASESPIRARRAETLALARSADPLPVSEAVMVSWARLVHACRSAGVHRMVKLTDSLIAATALEHGLPVVTQDDDFDHIAGAYPSLEVLKV